MTHSFIYEPAILKTEKTYVLSLAIIDQRSAEGRADFRASLTEDYAVSLSLARTNDLIRLRRSWRRSMSLGAKKAVR